jgi:DNA-binding winged helix-turn-helix (wHTH) protein/TolB-like protein/tetratricopeptide (TPR) repeat protein
VDARVDRERLTFGHFCLDPRSDRLFRREGIGDWVQVPIGSRALHILRVLVASPGAVVSKDAIMDAVWPGVAVEPTNLTVQIAALRRVLDEDHEGASCIQTISGRGYRLALDVTRPTEAQIAAAPTPAAEVGASSRVHARPRRAAWRWPIAAVGARATIAGTTAAAALLTAGGWWIQQSGTALPASSATQQSQAPDRRLSTMILPFENSSGDVAQGSLAAEITRHLTERIAKAEEGLVLVGMTAGVSQGGLPDLQAIGRERDVHFVLAGNAQRLEGRLIVSAVLYNTGEARAVWGQQVNVPDGPSALATIGQVIYENWWQASVDGEARHAAREHPDRLDNRDLLLMALATPLATPTKANYLQKLSLMDRALAQDPNYFLGLERRARWHAEFVLSGYSSDPDAELAIATEAADHTLAIDPNRLNSLRVKATVLRARGDWTGAEALLRRVLTLQPTEANRHLELGQCLMAQGRHQEALMSFQTARQFAGGTDPVYSYDANIAMANLALGQLAEAITTARLAISEMPPDVGRVGELPWLALIAATSASGSDEAARAELRKFLAMPRSWHSMTEVQRWPAFAANPKLIDGLCQAGMLAE